MIQPLFPPSQNINNIAQIQTPDNTNYIIQSDTPVYQTQYEKYKNISEIPHKGIKEIDENTFYISDGCCHLAFPSSFLILGIGEIVLGICLVIKKIIGYLILMAILAHAGIFVSIGLCIIYFNCNIVYFIKGSNSLTLIKKSLFNRRKKIIYQAGELEKVKFEYNNKCSNNIIFIFTNGNLEEIFSLSNNNCHFTREEIEYFLYHINSHIQNKMRG